jgi:hypothetical protein
MHTAATPPKEWALFGFFLVMKAELVREYTIMRRYWFRSLIGIAMGYGMLMVLIVGFVYSRPAVEASMNRFDDPAAATNFVLGFIVGLYAFGIVGMFSQGLQGMMSTGVLEQLCMSPHGLITNFLARSMVGSIMTVLTSGLMVWMIAQSVGGQLHFDLLPVLVVLGLTFANLLGFGFMIGGLVLVVKQVGQIAIIIRMVLFGLALFAREEIMGKNLAFDIVMHALPITDAAICLKYVLIKGQLDADGNFVSLFAYPHLYFLLVSCVVWTLIGVAVFKYMENWSRHKGTLGSY